MIENLNQRQKEILSIFSEDWNTSVSKIGRELDVSTVTIRSDLDTLADNGFIVRTRGGAIPAMNQRIIVRQKSMIEEKTEIARSAAELVQDGDYIMIGAGTTTALVAKYLFGKRDIKIVTNSILVMNYARINPSLSVTLVGGEYCPSAEALVGPITIRELEQFHVRLAFLGADGFSLDHGLTADLVEMAEVVKKMAIQAEQDVFLVDSSKYGKAGFAHIQPLTDTIKIITDGSLVKDSRQELEEKGLTILK